MSCEYIQYMDNILLIEIAVYLILYVKRKLIRFGKSAFCVTLPIDWVRKNNLEKGQELDVEETLHNSLEIIPAITNTHELTSSIELDLYGMSVEEAKYLLRAAYINGYFVIIFTRVSKEVMESLRNSINDFIAAEVMEVNGGRMEVHIFWDVKNINLESILQRIRFLVQNIFSETVSLLDSDSPNFDPIDENAKSLERQVLLARRATTYALLNAQIAHQFKYSSIELHYMSFMTQYLGNIGEYLTDFSRITVESQDLSEKERNKLASLVRSAEHYMRQLLDAQQKNKRAPFVMGAFIDFKRTIEELRESYPDSWTSPVLSEYLRLIFARIQETEFILISMGNAPK